MTGTYNFNVRPESPIYMDMDYDIVVSFYYCVDAIPFD
jgi:hypothetical protein